ncbi:MAG: sporulation protein YqfD [Clostridia bacterium]|nr:sporulation protein YqfD [Clostridia bacterium]
MIGRMMVRFRLDGLGAEKMLNAARQQGLPLEKVERGKNREIFLHCPMRSYPAFCELAREKGFSVGEAIPVGGYCWLQYLRSRWGLIAGAALCLALLIASMGCVWQVQVENAGAYAGEVRLFLQEMGVKAGIRKADVDVSLLREKLEWRLPRVKWVQVEMRGVVLAVRLEEGVPPPEIESAGAPGDVIAASDGILTRLTVFSGTPAAKTGDYVRKGQILIRGEERGSDGVMIPVKARGEAMARSWATARVQLPLWEMISLPTGRQEDRRVIMSPVFSFSAAEEAEYLTSDRRIETLPLGGAWFPLWLQREEFLEVSLEKSQRDAEEVKQEGARAALQMLNQSLNPNEIVDKWVDFSMIEGDTIVVEATAEIIRDIGRYQKN